MMKMHQKTQEHTRREVTLSTETEIREPIKISTLSVAPLVRVFTVGLAKHLIMLVELNLSESQQPREVASVADEKTGSEMQIRELCVVRPVFEPRLVDNTAAKKKHSTLPSECWVARELISGKGQGELQWSAMTLLKRYAHDLSIITAPLSFPNLANIFQIP